MKRPRGFVVLACLLFFLALGAIPASIAALVSQPEQLVLPRVIGILGLLYGVLALVSGLTLWRYSRQAPRLFMSWSLSAVALLVSFQVGPVAMPLWFFLTRFLPIVVLLLLGYHYVLRRSASAV